MTISALDAAKTVCKLGGWSLTNLKLQKILYISHMVYMGKNAGEHLIDEPFEAWDYGPVLSSVYRKVSRFGAQPISDIFFEADFVTSGKEKSLLEEACSFLASKSAYYLVAVTHLKGGAWEKNYQPGELGILIPDNDILDEYQKFYAR